MKQVVLSLNHQDKISEPIVACIGYFDGFHLGHMALIDQVKNQAKLDKAKTAMISFHPDPWTIVKKSSNITHLTTLADRIELAALAGIDYWIIIQFTKELSELSPKDFVNKMLCNLPLTTLVAGFDFRFGYKGAGDATFLQNNYQCFKTIVVDQVSDDHNKISTTRISVSIANGEIEKANELLGRAYSVKGIVIHGNKRGREIGFPTANVDFSIEYLPPKQGVYIGAVILKDKYYPAMINVGHNPTFNAKNNLSVEAYILDFNQDIYGQELEVIFYKRIRAEMKFASIQMLIDQMNEDYFTTRTYFENNENNEN
jgi:riboflavin kinase/FMN adenylyltransferase